ncbi:Non-LTR (Long terminal repeat) retrotransposon and domain-containing protein [Elysia marginata]|uniref:Non-LTR (Long terminal repeat) retrotransposon and domain-containing protein n=1 Tax=Elysia marginata TaxID=1093978 RepID=A0AAV4G3G6_9GAST|nr:Non-LTR (Long terminal repeat) retrotransposon and domain-containing protein [Elysia marginata]
MRSWILERGDAERVPDDEVEATTRWYIPHHGVYHPKKPGKIRVVFDCSARHLGICLNDLLLQGPDLVNALSGVLCRFRKRPIAFSCDIEKMYHQFHVPKPHRDYLRFLWWENGDTNAPLVDYRMKVHIYGAKSFPACANFGLKQLAKDNSFVSPSASISSTRFLCV